MRRRARRTSWIRTGSRPRARSASPSRASGKRWKRSTGSRTKMARLCLEPKGGKDACAVPASNRTLQVPGACPVFANPDAIGYYRVAWPEKDVAALLKSLDTATIGTRIAALADAWAQARAGHLDG